MMAMDRGMSMAMPTEELLHQYFDDRLALARLGFLQRMGRFPEADLTVGQLRIVLLIASGVTSSRARLLALLGQPEEELDQDLEQLHHKGYLERTGTEGIQLMPTETAMDVLDAVADRKDSIMELLAAMDPQDLAALVRGTHALRSAMELDAAMEHSAMILGEQILKMRQD